MTYDDAMTLMKQGRVVRREGWQGHLRVEGLQMIRVKPDIRPYQFYASREDRAATDWVASVPPATSALSPVNLAAKVFGEGVDGNADAR